MRTGYPMLLDVSNRLVVIVGGGAVAVRKAKGLLAAGATRVRCVSPTFHADLPEAVERYEGTFQLGHLDGAELVFAATDQPEVNESVVREARRRGIFVDRADADDAHPGDFLTPAAWRSGSIVLAVSAGSPALSAKIRDELVEKIDRRYVQLADALRDARPWVRDAAGLSNDRRQRAMSDLTSPQAMEKAGAGGFEAIKVWMINRYPELSQTSRRESR